MKTAAIVQTMARLKAVHFPPAHGLGYDVSARNAFAPTGRDSNPRVPGDSLHSDGSLAGTLNAVSEVHQALPKDGADMGIRGLTAVTWHLIPPFTS